MSAAPKKKQTNASRRVTPDLTRRQAELIEAEMSYIVMASTDRNHVRLAEGVLVALARAGVGAVALKNGQVIGRGLLT